CRERAPAGGGAGSGSPPPGGPPPPPPRKPPRGGRAGGPRGGRRGSPPPWADSRARWPPWPGRRPAGPASTGRFDARSTRCPASLARLPSSSPAPRPARGEAAWSRCSPSRSWRLFEGCQERHRALVLNAEGLQKLSHQLSLEPAAARRAAGERDASAGHAAVASGGPARILADLPDQPAGMHPAVLRPQREVELVLVGAVGERPLRPLEEHHSLGHLGHHVGRVDLVKVGYHRRPVQPRPLDRRVVEAEVARGKL